MLEIYGMKLGSLMFFQNNTTRCLFTQMCWIGIGISYYDKTLDQNIFLRKAILSCQVRKIIRVMTMEGDMYLRYFIIYIIFVCFCCHYFANYIVFLFILLAFYNIIGKIHQCFYTLFCNFTVLKTKYFQLGTLQEFSLHSRV